MGTQWQPKWGVKQGKEFDVGTESWSVLYWQLMEKRKESDRLEAPSTTMGERRDREHKYKELCDRWR